jgi:branched-chain amino acid transport system ATP-binding protein
MDIICGLLAPDAGRVEIQGRDVTCQPPWEVAALGVRRAYQPPRVFAGQTVEENLRAGYGYGRAAGPLRAFTRNDADRVARRQAGEISAKLGLATLARKRAGELSHGQKRMLEIARALMGGPRLMLLDEPMAGLSPQAREELKGVLRNLQRDGVTILFVEHDFRAVLDLAERVHVLEHGTKIAEGTPHEVRRDERVLKSFLGRRWSGAA